MILLISPAKTLDFAEVSETPHTQPRLLDQSQQLVGLLRKKTAEELQSLMNISDRLAALNAERYRRFTSPFTTENAKPALLAFQGDVYAGLGAEDFDEAQLAFAQRHLRILSGLYGLLRPLDLMQAYRLEMGTRLENARGKDLYAFWDDALTELLNRDLAELESDAVVNLASQEYFKAIQPEKLAGRLFDIQFKEQRDGKYRIISFNAKKARGLMCRYVVQNRITDPEALVNFDWDDYFFNPDLSSERSFVFTR